MKPPVFWHMLQFPNHLSVLAVPGGFLFHTPSRGKRWIYVTWWRFSPKLRFLCDVWFVGFGSVHLGVAHFQMKMNKLAAWKEGGSAGAFLYPGYGEIPQHLLLIPKSYLKIQSRLPDPFFLGSSCPLVHFSTWHAKFFCMKCATTTGAPVLSLRHFLI